MESSSGSDVSEGSAEEGSGSDYGKRSIRSKGKATGKARAQEGSRKSTRASRKVYDNLGEAEITGGKESKQDVEMSDQEEETGSESGAEDGGSQESEGSDEEVQVVPSTRSR